VGYTTATRDDGPVLLLGPMTRYADDTVVTVWVETSAPCEVEVRAGPVHCSEHSFEVEGHHYALIAVRPLEPGTDVPYTVYLDGRRCWPEDGDPRPAPRLRTRGPGADLEVVFGSCRVDRPNEPPWSLEPEQDARGYGADALVALSVACARGERPVPDLLVMLGDQVYADEGLAPVIRRM
jgi:hypothetical protein